MSIDTQAVDSMRLFYALWPDDATREKLQHLQTLVQGRHVLYANLHVTLAFLGNQPLTNLPLLKTILANLPRADITLQLDRLGYFSKSRIAWAGTHAVPDELLAWQSSLAHVLEQHDITFDRKGKFTPHVTLARDADLPLDCPFDAITWHASQVALVQSLQQGGALAYRVLAMRNLTEPA